MALIVYDLDRAVQLGAESLIRPFAFGTNWQKIRVGMLCSVNASIGSLIGTVNAPRLGVCTGNKADLDSNTTDAIWFPFYSSGVTFSIGGSSPALWVYTTAGTGTVASQKVGATTSGIGSVTTSSQALSLSPYLRLPMFVDITKGTVGSATIAISMWTAQNVTASIDRSNGEFLAAMEAASPANTDEDAASSPSLPLRTAKDWDSMFITWSRTVPTLNVYQMAVTRFI